MRKFFLLLCAACFSAIGSTQAQTARDRQTIRIKTSVECQMCQKRIENYFKKMPGIINLNVNYHNKLVTVNYLSSRTSPSNIRTAIANLGYDADTVTANPFYYNKLPDCCKKGGMEAKRKAEMEARRQKLRAKKP